jgi:hypothetical protein
MDGEVRIHLADGEFKERVGRFGNEHSSAFAARGPRVSGRKIVQNKANLAAARVTLTVVKERRYERKAGVRGLRKQSQFCRGGRMLCPLERVK